MHGTVVATLESFVTENYGADAWQSILTAAGVGGLQVDPLTTYPDEQVVAVVGAACEATGLDLHTVLRAFGAYIAPKLLEMYWSLIAKDWTTLDIIEHTEDQIHRVVRLDHEGAAPPQLEAKRVSDTEVLLTYRSVRKMCDLAKGIGDGLAKHFDENVQVSESQCMHDGADECLILFTNKG